MNLWGFTRSYLDEAWARFPAFLDRALSTDPQKAEYYLPAVVSQLLDAGKARVKVLRSHDRWYSGSLPRGQARRLCRHRLYDRPGPVPGAAVGKLLSRQSGGTQRGLLFFPPCVIMGAQFSGMGDADMDRRLRTIWTLFGTFLKIGAFTFGGGYAMIPLIQKEVVEKRNWITNEDVLDIIAIAESTPGPIAVNSATFVGYRVCGFWGALCGTLGVVLPSFLIIAGISYVLQAFESNRIVQCAFAGIRAGVLALICRALASMYRQCPRHWFSLLVAGAAFFATAFLQVNVLLVIAGCAAAGLLFSLAARRRQG